jgi:tRNA G46 methylase TrmB
MQTVSERKDGDWRDSSANDEAAEEDNFLGALGWWDNDYERNDEPKNRPCNDVATASKPSQPADDALAAALIPQYTCKKPLWWKRQSAKGISKGQRRAVNDPAMQRFKLVKPAYGTKLQWNQVYNINVKKGKPREIWLELGFGLGDNLLCLASQQSRCCCNYVGAEVHAAGIGTVFSRMQSGIRHNEYWDGYTEWKDATTTTTTTTTTTQRTTTALTTAPADNDATTTTLYDHVRVYAGDGTKLLHSIPDQSVAAVLITFPDPFPLKHQQHWRLLQLDILSELRRVLLATRGRLYLATDHEGYHDWSHQQVKAFNQLQRDCRGNDNHNPTTLFKLVEPTPDRALWLPVVSKYEQKGRNEGRTTWLSCWEAR